MIARPMPTEFDRRKHATRMFCWCLALLLLVRAAPAQPSPDSVRSAAAPKLDSPARAEIAETFARVLADAYAYADKGARMAGAVRAKLESGAYDGITSPPAFAEALQADARGIADDRHLWVAFTGGGAQIRTIRRGGPPSPEALDQMRKQNAAIPEARILDGNIGYMPVNGMLPAQAGNDAIAAAFAFLHNTDALIIDLRDNPGGSGYAEVYLSYLSEGAPYVTGSVHWRKDNRVVQFKTTDMGRASYGAKKPVFVLTSRDTFSAAEGLAYDLQAFKRGTLVGETTGGGANPSAGGGMVPLGHSFFANVPTGYVVNAATGTNWEGVGVKPDVPVPAGQALAKAWSLAADELKRHATDPAARDALAAIAQAKLDGSPSLTHAQIVGTYARTGGRALAGGSRIPISEKDGMLHQEQVLFRSGVREARDTALVPAGGDRFVPQGSAYGSSSLTFFADGGKLKLLKVDRMGSSIWEQLQPAR